MLDYPKLPANVCVADDVKLGENVRLAPFVNLYGCEVGDETRIGAFVEIQKQAVVGRDCKISSHSFICSGVRIEDGVFVGHGVVFINDRHPHAINPDGSVKGEKDWHLEETRVCKGASIGSGAVIMCGLTIGEHAMVGAGALVTRDVPPFAVVAGNPATVRRYVHREEAGPDTKGKMPIKFIDLAAMNREVRDRVDREIAEIHEHTAYIGGAHVAAFEKEFAAYLGVKHVVGVGSGTDALRMALLASNIGAGDEVITTPMTFVATAEAIVQTGARLVLVDIDPENFTLSPQALGRYFELLPRNGKRHQRVILPVHLYGLPAAMPAINEIAARYGAIVIEDACQAHGARIETEAGWVRAGAASTAGCFSFYPGKNLGAWGDGGAVALNDTGMAERLLSLRDHGRTSHYEHREYGFTSRLDAIQAAVLRAKLERLDEWNQRRRAIAKIYRELFAGTGAVTQQEPAAVESCYHLFVVRSGKRDAIRQALADNRIECGIHYPVPLHLQPACSALGYGRGTFPNAERLADTVLSLPIHPALSETEAIRVATVVLEVVGREATQRIEAEVDAHSVCGK